MTFSLSFSKNSIIFSGESGRYSLHSAISFGFPCSDGIQPLLPTLQLRSISFENFCSNSSTVIPCDSRTTFTYSLNLSVIKNKLEFVISLSCNVVKSHGTSFFSSVSLFSILLKSICGIE